MLDGMGKLSTIPHGHAALRCGRVSMSGRVYLVTFTTHGRQAWFADPEVARVVAGTTTDSRLWIGSDLLAWVLMPDHWHGLVGLGAHDYLPTLVQRLKSNTARHVRHMAPRLERLWAKGYHDHALRTDEAVIEAARHLVMHPVRAGLVARVGDYPYWDAVWMGSG